MLKGHVLIGPGFVPMCRLVGRINAYIKACKRHVDFQVEYHKLPFIGVRCRPVARAKAFLGSVASIRTPGHSSGADR